MDFDKLPIAKLKMLARVNQVSTLGCFEKHEIVERLRKAGVPEEGAGDTETKAETPFGGAAAGAAAGVPAASSAEEPPTKKAKVDSVESKPAAAAAAPAEPPRCEACEKEPADFAIVKCVQCKAHMCKECNVANHASKLLKGHQRLNLDGTPVVEKPCEGCEKDIPDTANVHCTNCKAFLCDACNEVNHPTRLLKGHVRVSVAEGIKAMEPPPVTYAPAPVKPAVEPTAGFFELSVARLKILAKQRGVNVAGCVEKKEIVEALRAAKVPEDAVKVFRDSSAAKADEAASAAVSSKTAQAAVQAGAEAQAWKVSSTPQPRVIAPPRSQTPQVPLTKHEMWQKRQEDQMVQNQRACELYEKYRPLFPEGGMFDMLTSFALWKDDWGQDRVLYLNHQRPNGWPNTVEVICHGQRRMRVRGMVYDRVTNKMKGNPQQMGWVDLTAIVDDFTGEVLLRPHESSGYMARESMAVKPPAWQQQAQARARDPDEGVTTNRWGRFRADGSGETVQSQASSTGKQVDMDAENL